MPILWYMLVAERLQAAGLVSLGALLSSFRHSGVTAAGIVILVYFGTPFVLSLFLPLLGLYLALLQRLFTCVVSRLDTTRGLGQPVAQAVMVVTHKIRDLSHLSWQLNGRLWWWGWFGQDAATQCNTSIFYTNFYYRLRQVHQSLRNLLCLVLHLMVQTHPAATCMTPGGQQLYGIIGPALCLQGRQTRDSARSECQIRGLFRLLLELTAVQNVANYHSNPTLSAVSASGQGCTPPQAYPFVCTSSWLSSGAYVVDLTATS
jgi:hypothetical protein